jgi:hypothetical protein
MGEWIPERDNEHLLSKNGLLDIAVRSEKSRKFTGISRINEAFTVHDKSLDGAKYKILLATRDKLLALLRDVEDVLKDSTEIEKVGVSRNGSTVALLNSPSLNNLAKWTVAKSNDIRDKRRRITP